MSIAPKNIPNSVEQETVLIVDDDVNNLKVLQRILESANYSIRPATSGKMALMSCRVAVPSLILLDIDMPEMNGIEVCRNLKNDKKLKDVPVLFVSASDNIGHKVAAFKTGGIDYITKPFQAEEILARVRTHLAHRNAQIELEQAHKKTEQEVKRRTAELALSNERLSRINTQDGILVQTMRLNMQELSEKTYLEKFLDILVSSNLWKDGGNNIAIAKKDAEKPHDHFSICSTPHFSLPKPVAEYGIVPDVRFSCANTHEIELLSSEKIQSEKIEMIQNSDPFLLSMMNDDVGSDPSSAMDYLCTPIMERNEVIGMILFQVSRQRSLTSQDSAFFMHLADILSASFSRRNAEAVVEHLAFHDPLTGLANRRLLKSKVEEQVAAFKRDDGYGALLFLDLDDFKLINDAYGHHHGDKLLLAVASCMKSILRPGDIAARWGGDEFIIFIPNLAEKEEDAIEMGLTIGNRLMQAVAEPKILANREFTISGSLGITLVNDKSTNFDQLLSEGDSAMYVAKRSGKNTVRFFKPEYQDKANLRLKIIEHMRRAIRENEFELHYQPQVNKEQEIVGAEALLRWSDPEIGTVSPKDFIPIAEESGLIIELGDLVLDMALRTLKAWMDEGILGPKFRQIAINFSSYQLESPDFVSNVQAALRKYDIPPDMLDIEITERTMLTRIEDKIVKMNELKKSGVKFSIDDFGTGYSSLSYLPKLPIDMLKIDQSFVSDVHTNNQLAAIVSTVTAMSETLGIATIAEGVESETEFEHLAASGTDYFQGYYFYKPLPEQSIRDLFEQNYFTDPKNILQLQRKKYG